MMHPNRLKNLNRASSRGGSLHRRNMDPVPAHDQVQLLQNQFFESYDVVTITEEIESLLKTLAIDKKQTFELYQENELLKERMVEEDRNKLQELKGERNSLMDTNRELEFEILMLEDVKKTVTAKEKQKYEDMEHKIETLQLN